MLAVRQVLLVRLDDRVEEDLQQEVQEFRALAATGIDPRTRKPFGDDVEAIFRTYLERNVPDDDEELLTVPRRGTPRRDPGANTESFTFADFVARWRTLPDVDGLSVLREVRRRGERMPVIILTARDDLTDKVEGLDAGASDYVTKPFKLEELLARTRVQLRDDGSGEPGTLEAGGITLDVRTRRAMAGGDPVDLTAREFTMLETFMRHAGQVLSREQLLAQVWGYDYDPGSNVVEVYVRYLRRKLGEEAIETVRGMGYRLGG